ncbi:uncharacterized protein LOC133284915 [Gastrolobium bilobum]|uniref:uncharacterized protein LOC133284915 n=1 Tax=Gastrolobium bilobum TaxID=150636 RepID=UPI002AB08333|nr:uncharacterized protein LOC133284915 [Gastrolobium bilobum]
MCTPRGLPLRYQTPPDADRRVILQSLPPHPLGMFYASGYPCGPSQQYWWPPQYVPSTSNSGQQGFPPSQYPSWFSAPSMPQRGFPPQTYHSFPGHSSGQSMPQERFPAHTPRVSRPV